MEKPELMMDFLKKLLRPEKAVVAVSVPAAGILLGYVFLLHHKDSPVAYAAYLFSAYALVILCVQTVHLAGPARAAARARLEQNSYICRWIYDPAFRMQVSLYLALSINLLYAVVKMVSVLYYHSVWFGTLATYYSLLAVMRFLLLTHVNRTECGADQATELRRYRLCGMIFLVMNIALSGVVVLVVKKNETFAYPGYLIYVMALYTFYNIAAAVRNVVRYRKYNSPVMLASKAISLAAALVCVFSLETAMLVQFGRGDSAVFRQIMTGATGSCVCLLVMGMSIFMICSATKKLRRSDGADEKGGNRR